MATYKVKELELPWSSDIYQFSSDPTIVTSTSKAYLVATTTTPASAAQEYIAVDNSPVYQQAGQLNSTEMRIAEVVTQKYNSTTESLDFVFS